MRKFLGLFLGASMLFAVGCGKRVPRHETITLPAGATLVNFNCEETCAIYWDPTLEAYVAVMEDGDTITIEMETDAK